MARVENLRLENTAYYQILFFLQSFTLYLTGFNSGDHSSDKKWKRRRRHSCLIVFILRPITGVLPNSRWIAFLIIYKRFENATGVLLEASVKLRWPRYFMQVII